MYKRQQQDGRQYHPGMNQSRHWRKRTGAHVGGRTGDGGGGGDAAEEGRGQIAQSLADQFGVGIVLAAGHAVGHHRAQQ